ncbi:unnamed protein product [Rotaria magnacalcarata]|uniref:Uncharacterized protein n=2 Tax=Rotaria magnacalcarata TaxID=392030 RepID=A0A816H9Z5_9BILA|nr:unnamed protein product [Rotaria magnacalcarata]CAF2087246.1 unnamed protein product [Rotaria magnacalcarata]CAF4253843.1 unnamed protein product [Rotaria magnacalcarata]
MSIRAIDHEHERLVTMVNQLMDEREILHRENEYLKAKLNQSILMETIHEMKRERSLLLKLLSNLTININQDEQLQGVKPRMKENNANILASPVYPKLNTKSVHCNNSLAEQNSAFPRHNPPIKTNNNRAYRLKANFEHKQKQNQSPAVIYRMENTNENSMNNSDRSSSSSSSIAHTKTSQSSRECFACKTSVMPQIQESNRLIRKQKIQLQHSQNSPFQHYRSQSLQDLT